MPTAAPPAGVALQSHVLGRDFLWDGEVYCMDGFFSQGLDKGATEERESEVNRVREKCNSTL